LNRDSPPFGPPTISCVKESGWHSTWFDRYVRSTVPRGRSSNPASKYSTKCPMKTSSSGRNLVRNLCFVEDWLMNRSRLLSLLLALFELRILALALALALMLLTLLLFPLLVLLLNTFFTRSDSSSTSSSDESVSYLVLRPGLTLSSSCKLPSSSLPLLLPLLLL